MDKGEERAIFKHILDNELHEELYHKTKHTLFEAKFELRKQIILAITAAFAFLIALSWKEPIQNTFILLLEKLGWTGKDLLLQYLSAILITIISVIILFLINGRILRNLKLKKN